MRKIEHYKYFFSEKSKFIFMVIALLFSYNLYAQDNSNWKNKKCAVVLTYDDGLNVHLDNVIPLLDSLGLKGTFYIPCSFKSFRNRVDEWKKAAKNGHELGNHTLFHPCDGKQKDREWVNKDYDLNNYSVERITDEILMNNFLLNMLDGKKKRTFAYTCGDMKAGGISFIDKIKENFIAARGVEGKMQKITDIDLYNIGSFMINGNTGTEMIDLVKKAMDNEYLLVFLFHGVGGEHGLNVSLDAHRELLYFLKQNEKSIWVAPLEEVAEFIKLNKNLKSENKQLKGKKCQKYLQNMPVMHF
jgi:peptidoglycan-N-acetylglucosamine deacetylase